MKLNVIIQPHECADSKKMWGDDPAADQLLGIQKCQEITNFYNAKEAASYVVGERAFLSD